MLANLYQTFEENYSNKCKPNKFVIYLCNKIERIFGLDNQPGLYIHTESNAMEYLLVA